MSVLRVIITFSAFFAVGSSVTGTDGGYDPDEMDKTCPMGECMNDMMNDNEYHMMGMVDESGNESTCDIQRDFNLLDLREDDHEAHPHSFAKMLLAKQIFGPERHGDSGRQRTEDANEEISGLIDQIKMLIEELLIMKFENTSKQGTRKEPEESENNRHVKRELKYQYDDYNDILEENKGKEESTSSSEEERYSRKEELEDSRQYSGEEDEEEEVGREQSEEENSSEGEIGSSEEAERNYPARRYERPPPYEGSYYARKEPRVGYSIGVRYERPPYRRDWFREQKGNPDPKYYHN